MKDGELIFAEVVGERKIGSGELIRLDDAFHLGSCTKAMTATMLAILVERGSLSWDAKIIDVFPEAADAIHPGFHSITLVHLLSHKAGLPKDVRPDRNFFPKLREMSGPVVFQRYELVKLVLANPPSYRPGECMVYSNYGYVVAAAMAEKVTGKSWEELMKTLIFKPLGMESAGFGPPRDVWGHRRLIFTCQPIAPGPDADNPPVLAPAGGIHCSVKDWAKFVSEHLKGLQGNSKLLSKETFEFLHKDHYDQGYALGWLVVERSWAGGLALTHGGSNGLWFAVVWVAPKRNIAFLAATNCGGKLAFSACQAAISKMIKRFLSYR
ncbi:hypothetical protein A4H02_03535 [Fervidobacterium thailandense]|uniref:Beta-lactamase-related domain-containing protein n=1 Tax=Fervidobacterium thailandense TaxID=1008305 RepID=A0A1E3G3S8_9BACT|nr:hypothetical protein A4H02_03535 [Fervidobacterium thailandense]